MLNKQHKLFLQIAIIVFAFGLLVFSCHSRNHTNDLKHYIEQLKISSTKQPKQHTTSALKLPQPVVYDEDAGRPPFGDIPKANQQTGSSPDEESNPLLAYSLSMLKFVGTVTQANVAMAFILAPNGMIYQVKVGSEIGDHHGKVIEIQDDRLQVMEQAAKIGNESGQRIVTLQLKDEQS